MERIESVLFNRMEVCRNARCTSLFLYVLLHVLYEIIFYFFQSQSVHINRLELLNGDIKIV